MVFDSKNLILSIVTSILVYFFGYQPYGFIPAVLASFSLSFVCFVFLEVILNKSIKFIYLGIFIGLNWIYFQSPFLLKEKTYYYTRTIDEMDIPDIALYSCLSIVLIFIGYTFFFNRVSALTSKKLKLKDSTLVELILIFLGLGLFDSLGTQFFSSTMDALSNVVQVFFYSYTIAFGLYTLLLLRTKTKFVFTPFNLLVITLFLLEFVIRVSSTMFVRTAFLFIGIFMAYFYERRKLPLAALIISLMILVPFYQSRKYFRQLKRINAESISENSQKYVFYRGQDYIKKIYTSEGEAALEQFDQSIQRRAKYQSNRLENLSFIAHVVHLHNIGMKEFLYGETFYWLPFTPIPRIIWKNKPMNLMSSTFATEYGLRGEGAGETSINFPMLVEAYVNFGYTGMLVLAFFFGAAIKWFAMKFGLGLGDINLIIMLNAIKQFTHAEGNITLVFGALLQVLIFWFVLLWILGVNKRIATV